MVSWPESSCSSPVTLKQTFFPFLSPFSLSLSAGIKGSGVLRSDLGEYVIEERRLQNTEIEKQIHVFQKWASNRITFHITILQLLFYNMWREYLNSVNIYLKEGKWHILLLKSLTVKLINLTKYLIMYRSNDSSWRRHTAQSQTLGIKLHIKRTIFKYEFCTS